MPVTCDWRIGADAIRMPSHKLPKLASFSLLHAADVRCPRGISDSAENLPSASANWYLQGFSIEPMGYEWSALGLANPAGARGGFVKPG